MGLSPFYGWVREDFKHDFNSSGVLIFNDDVSLDGSHWGISASLGGTIKFKPVTLEPFISGGWQQLKLNGDGDRRTATGTVINLWEMDKARNEWSIGGGFSVLYDL
jgi:hypothetical protein